jgi:hypothetical protein
VCCRVRIGGARRRRHQHREILRAGFFFLAFFVLRPVESSDDGLSVLRCVQELGLGKHKHLDGGMKHKLLKVTAALTMSSIYASVLD